MVGEWDGKHGLGVYQVSYPITIQWIPMGAKRTPITIQWIVSGKILQENPIFNGKNKVRAPAGALYCLRFSKCISSHLIHKIVENPMILDTYHQKLWTCTCAKTWNRALKNECFHQNSLCFPMYLQTPSEIA